MELVRLTDVGAAAAPLTPYASVMGQLTSVLSVSQDCLKGIKAGIADSCSRTVWVGCCLKITTTYLRGIAQALSNLDPTSDPTLAGRESLISNYHQLTEELQKVTSRLELAQEALDTRPDDMRSRSIASVIEAQRNIAECFQSYFTQFHSNRTLDLSSTPDIGDEEALRRLSAFPYPLLQLNLQGCRNLSVPTLLAFAQRCEGITHLNLKGTQADSAVLAAFLAQASDNGIVSVSFSFGPEVPANSLLPHLSKLKNGSIRGVDHFFPTGIEAEALRSLLPKLQRGGAIVPCSLNFYQLGLPDDLLQSLASKYRVGPVSLINFAGTQASDETVRKYLDLCENNSIRKVSLNGTRVTDRTLCKLVEKCLANGLQWLDLGGVHASDDAMSRLLACAGPDNSMRYLNIWDTKAERGTLISFINRCADGRLPTVHLPLRHCHVEVLNALMPKCQDSSLSLSDLPTSYRSERWWNRENIDEDFIQRLLPKLKDNSLTGGLKLSYCTISDSSVHQLARKYKDAEGITSLDLKGIQLKPETVRSLLRRVPQSGLKSVMLANTGLSDDVLQLIAQYSRNLEYLELDGLAVSAKTLLDFAGRCKQGINWVSIPNQDKGVAQTFMAKKGEKPTKFNVGFEPPPSGCVLQ